MRPWRLIIEVGTNDEPAPAGATRPSSSAPELSVDRSEAWSILVDARQKMLNMRSGGNHADADRIDTWIGGGLAVMAKIFNEDAQGLLSRLVGEVGTTPTASNPLTGNLVLADEPADRVPNRGVAFYQVERKRPEPPPGAPRPLDPADLTPEEREELGIILPGEDRNEDDVEATNDDVVAEDPSAE